MEDLHWTCTSSYRLAGDGPARFGQMRTKTKKKRKIKIPDSPLAYVEH